MTVDKISLTSSSFNCADNGLIFEIENGFSETPHCYKGKEALQKVFKDHFSELESSNPRPVVIREVKKMINCKNPDNGTYYVCPDCYYQCYVPFTCKSHFCPSCGILINKQRCVSISNVLLDFDHRQWVFTMPDSLWHYFRDNWPLINNIFNAASDTIRHFSKRICPQLDVEPGYVGVLHSFGRSDKSFEPHIHFLVTCGGITKYGSWFNIKHYPYKDINVFYRDRLLHYLSLPSVLGSRFRKEAHMLAEKYPNGFVVNCPPPDDHLKGNTKKVVSYITRYIARPCIASSRIDSYDGTNIVYHFTPHDSDTSVTSTMDALSFMQMLTQHIPDDNFRVLRYYGVYNRSNHADSERVKKLTSSSDIKFLYSPDTRYYRQYYSHWRGAMVHSFHVDPLSCPECGCSDMLAYFSKYNGKTYYAPNTVPRYQISPPNPPKKAT